ncbi:MAG: hypothetical protein OZSIB_3969 [Candidatus Ozemobacter sibiricus]|jgi:flagellar biosynthesis anti-sigma factor FlgM|uniref:Anti-sigma-28 factor FlgM C-terminal domain-containing protein n=1 Tax=Candidatus Ozemobacter sibiricus TaxID=2268124 RepID=A0A367ZNW7_9BACT|nr:MAG: hypothetical protein OZSIB_3969 [Candidatus Ozemobacter sibiricus]
MKVSNRIDIARIYQDQVKKTQGDSGDAFKKVMQEATGATAGAAKPTFHPPSGLNLARPVFAGKPVPQADPVETARFAAEVVANEPDIRAEKVERIKKLFESGQYNIPPEKVAERLLASRVLTDPWEG